MYVSDNEPTSAFDMGSIVMAMFKELLWDVCGSCTYYEQCWTWFACYYNQGDQATRVGHNL